MQFEKDMVSPHKTLFLSIRKIILGTDNIEEIKKDKITTYSYNGTSLCHLRTMPNGVDVGFLKGTLMADKFGLLHGETKRMKVFSLEKLMKKELNYYLEEAAKLNS